MIQSLPHFSRQLLEGVGFLYETPATAVQYFLCLSVEAVAARQEYFDRRIHLLQMIVGLPTAHFRHDHIQDDEINSFLFLSIDFYSIPVGEVRIQVQITRGAACRLLCGIPG